MDGAQCIHTCWRPLQHPNFSFNVFYDKLNARGLCIYPGKVTQADCFRIGNIGQLYPDDMRRLLQAW
jgi:2-aminoethylphosphonate-pyruvate transaminase